MLTAFTDIDLWNAASRGDREAFGEIFRRYYNLLYQYGNKICTDTATLEDCIQELFVEIWQKKTNTDVQSVKAYLLQALKYKLYKNFRDNKTVYALNEKSNEPFELSHENFLISANDDSEKIKKIVDAINQLPARQKEVIYLKIYKGLSYEEVSEIMQINYQVVRNLLCQALKTFRKIITPCLVLLAASLYYSVLLCQ